ncbi:hypothetical protein PGW94_04045, partial [Candidatus Anaplasma sp. TIGMIC]|nr:hypothetical protein [Candidatus Anaplasma sp. TIGMIC]
SIRVKFVPMAFALQDYTKPGIRVVVYKGEKIVQREYIFPSMNTLYEMSDNAVARRLRRAVSARNNELETNMYKSISKGTKSVEYIAARKDHVWNSIYYKGRAGEVEDKKEDMKNELDVYGATHTYTARRGDDDSVCIKYYGANSKDKSLPLVSTCLPIPGLDLPTMYALPDVLTSKFSNPYCFSAKAKERNGSLWQHLSLKYSTDKRDRQCIGKILKPTDLFYGGNAGLKRSIPQEDCSLGNTNNRGYKAGKRFLGYQVWMHEGVRKDWLQHGILLDYARSLCRIASFPRDKGDGTTSLSSACVYSNSLYSSVRVFPVSNPTASYGIEDRQSGVVCADGVLHRDIELEVISECRAGEECASKVMPPGVIEGILERSTRSRANASSSMEAVEGGEYTTESRSRRYTSFRVRKKPKALRRYVIVNNGGINRRIRCDDKYSIDLHSVSQEVLDQSQVSNNKFVFPKSYLENSVRSDSEDLCNSSGSNIVYYYEGGGFVANNTGLEACGNPVEEYYAPDKKVVGCEYDYIRTDNYEPFLPGVSAALQVAALPVSAYEQGLCVDGFEKSWFRPDYHTAITSVDGSWGLVGAGTQPCCYWKSVDITRAKTKQERNVYRYMLQRGAKSAEDSSVCTLYRVEMWGGGESAATTEPGIQRSGRPGQYTMVLLDYSKLQGKSAEYIERAKVNGNRQSVEYLVSSVNGADSHSLVFMIGEGGKQGQKGDDTVLRLCKDDFWVVHKQRLGEVLPWGSVFSDSQTMHHGTAKSYPGNDSCYEIAKAVGGGSKKAGELQYDIAKDVVVYYKTIIGDVLQGDGSAQGLLESGSAMFTKFPLEMNLGIKTNGNSGGDPIEEVMANRRFFEGRSLPREFCKYKQDRDSKSWDGANLGVFIPGMGGCWDDEGNRPGVGENGAVMITCERWVKSNS